MVVTELVLLIQITTTISMMAVIWFVQCVHYPLFALVGKEAFCDYERCHVQRIGWVVAH